MKAIIFLILFSFANCIYSQTIEKKNTIKVAKKETQAADSLCIANILGYTGENIVKKEDLIKVATIEVSKSCNLEINSYMVSYDEGNILVDIQTLSNKINFITLFSSVKTDPIKITIWNIIAQDLSTCEEVILPPISFNLLK